MHGIHPRRAALYGLLLALALILSYVESCIPVFFAVPGIKLGLANIVVLFALYSLGISAAAAISLLRIFLVSLLFGTGASFFYSLSGGILSLAVMVLLKHFKLFRMPVVSIAGGVFHNLGQILAAMVLLNTPSLAHYMAILWFTGMLTGLIIGILGAVLLQRTGPVLHSTFMTQNK